MKPFWDICQFYF